MFILYAVVLGIILGYASKGRLKNMHLRPLHWKGFAIFALAIQLVIFSDFSIVEALSALLISILHYFSYVCLLVFVIRNIKNIGISAVGIGTFLNALVIFINGGYMPTISQNLDNTSFGKSANLIDEGVAVHNSAKTTSETLLPWLGDIFYLPSWIPLSNVFSIGDVLIAVGICIYIIINMHPVKVE